MPQSSLGQCAMTSFLCSKTHLPLPRTQLQKVCTQQQKPSVAKNNKQILKQKLLKLTINYSKVSKYKAKIRKSIIFLYAE